MFSDALRKNIPLGSTQKRFQDVQKTHQSIKIMFNALKPTPLCHQY